MPMTDDARRITITLTPDERDALACLAMRERRNTRQQAAMLIRKELVRHGLLPVAEFAQAGEVTE